MSTKCSLHRHFKLKKNKKTGKQFSIRKSQNNAGDYYKIDFVSSHNMKVLTFRLVSSSQRQKFIYVQHSWLENIKSCCFIVYRKWYLTRTFHFLIISQERKSLPWDSCFSELFTFQCKLYKMNSTAAFNPYKE